MRRRRTRGHLVWRLGIRGIIGGSVRGLEGVVKEGWVVVAHGL